MEKFIKQKASPILYSHICILSQILVPIINLICNNNQHEYHQLLITFQTVILLSSIIFIKYTYIFIMLILLAYAQIIQFYHPFMNFSVFYLAQILLLALLLPLSDKKNQSNLQSSKFNEQIVNKKNHLEIELLAPQYHTYEKHPQQYILERMKKVRRWQDQDQQYLRKFLIQLASFYNLIPYHNLTHAFDVTVNLDKYLVDYGLMEQLDMSQQERIYMLISAFAHDSGHEGFTNNYYNSRHQQLALIYSYCSPLENMHCSNLMRTLRRFPGIVPQKNRKLMVKVILATDNFAHKNTIPQLKTMNGAIKRQNYEFMLEVLLHTADINNPGKQLDIFLKWNQRLYKQFDHQNNLLNIESIRVRRQSQTQRNQVKFLKGAIWPLYKQLSLINKNFDQLVKQVEKNIKHWQKF